MFLSIKYITYITTQSRPPNEEGLRLSLDKRQASGVWPCQSLPGDKEGLALLKK